MMCWLSNSCCPRALAAYKDFLALRKDADPGIPILKEAKTEYAKLQEAIRLLLICGKGPIS